MYANLITNSWVSIRDGCQLRYRVSEDDCVDFTVKDGVQIFEFEYHAEALRQFVELAVRALAEMDALRVGEPVEPMERT
jgi:hypothetical protein